MTKILPRFPQWISPRILLPVANLGEIPGKIAPRFLPPWICSSAGILARFAVAFRRDFGRRDYCFPARILVRLTAGTVFLVHIGINLHLWVFQKAKLYSLKRLVQFQLFEKLTRANLTSKLNSKPYDYLYKTAPKSQFFQIWSTW